MLLQPDMQLHRPGLLRLVRSRRPSPSSSTRPTSRSWRRTRSSSRSRLLRGDPAGRGGVPRVDVQHQLRQRRAVPRTPGTAAAQGRPQLPAVRVTARPGLQRAARAADRDDQGGWSGSTTRTSRWSSSTTTPTIRPCGSRWRSTAEGRERVKFIHVAPWPGYKAGACNLVLRQYTDPRAEIIGLVDADDIVQPYYLREAAPYFSDPSIGFVQTFEGNRDFQGSHYYTGLRGLLPGLLPVGHVLAQRAQHGPLRGHDGAVPAQRAGRGRAAGTSGASARTPRPRSG